MNDLASADPNIQTAMLEVISEGVSGGLLVYDKNDLVVFASQQLLNLLPVPKSFLAPGTRIRDFLGAVYDSGGRFAADAAGPRRLLSREDWVAEQIATLWKERAETLERRGTDRWVSFSKRRLSSGYGVTVVRDVSEHKKREEQWRADMERVQITEEVLDNLPFPITVKDSNRIFVAVNKAASAFLDLPPEAILGRKGSDINPPELEERLSLINRQVLESGETYRLPELVTRPNGSPTAIVANKYRIGKPGRYYLVTAMEDISGFVDLDEESGEMLPRMTGVELVRSSLRNRKPQSSGSAASQEECILNRKILIVSSTPDVAGKAQLLLAGLGADTSSVVSAEELQLFLDLAAASSIRIDLVAIDATMEAGCHEIVGEYGIASVDIDPAQTATGLVPAVRQALVAQAEPALESEAGAIDTDVVIRAEPVRGAAAIDILVAEDNDVNQIVFSQILEGLGYSYAIATDGEEAVRLWQERTPRLVLMDITLPKLTGFEAAFRIRSLETLENSVPIIGVLPQAFDRDRDECFAAGMNDVILKPISPEAIEALFETYLERGDRPSSHNAYG